MDEQTAWRGHSFTLLIFGGVVVLCSIFFILGMLVGRNQVLVPAVAEIPSVADDAPIEPVEPEDLDLRFYEAVDADEPPPLEAAASLSPLPPEPEPEPVAAPGEVRPTVTLQIAALRNADQAESLRGEIAAMGFPSFVLRPGADDASALYRVRVGPFSDEAEAARVRALLEAEGYQSIVRN